MQVAIGHPTRPDFVALSALSQPKDWASEGLLQGFVVTLWVRGGRVSSSIVDSVYSGVILT